MRKKELNSILKMLKKGNLNGISFMPTLEECDYLNSKGVDVSLIRLSRSSLISDKAYLVELTNFEVSANA